MRARRRAPAQPRGSGSGRCPPRGSPLLVRAIPRNQMDSKKCFRNVCLCQFRAARTGRGAPWSGVALTRAGPIPPAPAAPSPRSPATRVRLAACTDGTARAWKARAVDSQAPRASHTPAAAHQMTVDWRHTDSDAFLSGYVRRSRWCGHPSGLWESNGSPAEVAYRTESHAGAPQPLRQTHTRCTAAAAGRPGCPLSRQLAMGKRHVQDGKISPGTCSIDGLVWL